LCRDSRTPRERQLVFVLAIHHHTRNRRTQHPRDQLSQFPITQPLPGTCSPPLAPKSRMPPPTAPRTTLARRSANLAPHASSPAATPNTPQKRRHARRFPAPFVARSVSRVPAGRIRTLA